MKCPQTLHSHCTYYASENSQSSASSKHRILILFNHISHMSMAYGNIYFTAKVLFFTSFHRLSVSVSACDVRRCISISQKNDGRRKRGECEKLIDQFVCKLLFYSCSSRRYLLTYTFLIVCCLTCIIIIVFSLLCLLLHNMLICVQKSLLRSSVM